MCSSNKTRTNKQEQTNKAQRNKRESPLRAPRPNKHIVDERAFVFSFSQPREDEKQFVACSFF